MTANTCSDSASAELSVRRAARNLYDAECALHDARQAQVDVWIAAAAKKLHQTILEHLAALATAAAA